MTGREPLIETNDSITVAATLAGKGIDFLETVAGVEPPFSQIPGDYLSNPKNPITNTPQTRSGAGAFIRDATGALGSLVGINRRPTTTKKPSDLFIEYLGRRQKNFLYDNLSYLRYGPDYTTTARSQNTSKIFAFTDNVAQGVNRLLGWEAPKLFAYIGDDRGNSVKYAMGDFNDRQVRSSYYLSILFDEVQAIAFTRTRNIAQGGGIAGKLTWISAYSQNKLGANNEEYQTEESQYSETLSTNFPFRDDSILGQTQEILNTLPSDAGAARSHVANVIDQTSRIFREDNQIMSRGSNIKYTDKFTGAETGVEYCRVWTKDRSYMNYSDTMKREGTIRKFDSSVLSAPWNLNIYPNSNGNGGFDSSSTNMAKGKGDGFYAKKYMFSIENLAWKTSNTPGFTYNDLPYCERGSNGGRIMWFPPYGLKVTEQNAANWEENIFLGRPEPVYTYQNTSRAGSIEFKVIVDHPSILNLMVKDLFKDMSEEESENYINAFFAGCEDLDFYDLIRKYVTLNESDVEKIMAYLNKNGDTETVTKYRTLVKRNPNTPTPKNEPRLQTFGTQLYYENDKPGVNPSRTTDSEFSNLYEAYTAGQDEYLATFEAGFDSLAVDPWTAGKRNDYEKLGGGNAPSKPTAAQFAELKAKCIESINKGFTDLTTNYTNFQSNLTNLKGSLEDEVVQDISIKLGSKTSFVADDEYNLDLAYRRSYTIIKDVINKIAKDPTAAATAISEFEWQRGTSNNDIADVEHPNPIKLSTLGHVGDGELSFKYVENSGEQPPGVSGSGTHNVDCSDNYTLNNRNLKLTAPLPFWCRESHVEVKYIIQDKDTPVPTQPAQEEQVVIEEVSPQQSLPSPPQDEMKKIIMKTLSECYYFKKLEDDSPIQFTSMKEKLRYFHPSFHSMTPEGLNTRLTFLHQCIRPGDTLPIKGVSDASDLNARNTTFGPPPICVMRIGDFYNSKVAIRDVNITFEDDLWDLNPEGIGVQPMIANVTMQVNFIGGHGLQKPVERLQNALSSNFYANTEMYDPKSISTETTIDGQDLTTFSQEFLNTLVEDQSIKENPTSQEPTKTETNYTQGQYIGEFGGFEFGTASGIGFIPNSLPTTMNYDKLVNLMFTQSYDYYSKFKGAYNSVVKQYGPTIGGAIISPDYRSITDYTVQTGAGTTDIQMLGDYPKGKDLSVIMRIFKPKVLQRIDEDNISTLFGFNRDLTAPVLRRSEEILKPYIKKRMGEIIDGVPKNTVFTDVEPTRNGFIEVFDRLNFIIETSHDGSITEEKYWSTTYTGYTYDLLYNTYSDVVTYVTNIEPEFYEDLDTTSYVFDANTTMTTDNLSLFLSEMLNSDEEKKKILDQYKKDPTIFTTRVLNNLEKRLNSFMTDVPTDKKFKSIDKKQPVPKDGNPIEFGISNFDYVFTTDEEADLKSVMTTSTNKTITTLNYYRNGKSIF